MLTNWFMLKVELTTSESKCGEANLTVKKINK